MKKTTQSFLLFLCLLAIPFYFLACNKDGGKVNITLHDKPLSTIQSYIQGKWDLRYIHGGYSPGTYLQNNLFWTFTSDNKVIKLYNDTITVDTSITWMKDEGLFIGPNNITYLMTFFNRDGVPEDYVIDGIFNDTLTIHDNAFDGYYFYFTKIK